MVSRKPSLKTRRDIDLSLGHSRHLTQTKRNVPVRRAGSSYKRDIDLPLGNSGNSRHPSNTMQFAPLSQIKRNMTDLPVHLTGPMPTIPYVMPNVVVPAGYYAAPPPRPPVRPVVPVRVRPPPPPPRQGVIANVGGAVVDVAQFGVGVVQGMWNLLAM